MNNTVAVKVAAITAYILIFVVLIIMRVIERSVKKDIKKNREWIQYFIKFSNDTYVLGYFLTSLGYLFVILDIGLFWFIYIVMAVAFSREFFRDLLIPFAINLRKRFGNGNIIS